MTNAKSITSTYKLQQPIYSSYMWNNKVDLCGVLRVPHIMISKYISFKQLGFIRYLQHYTPVSIKKQPLWLLNITFANEDRFSKLFHWHICKRKLYVLATEFSSSPYLCYTTSWNLKIQNNLVYKSNVVVISPFLPQMLIICNRNFGKCALDNKL